MASTISNQNANYSLTSRTHLRIDDLNVDTLPNVHYIEAKVALVWPYSSSTRQLSLLLAEQDVLLRKAKGQLKVIFHGAGAREIARTRVGIGDKVKIGLDQFELVLEHDILSTPGKKADFDLHVRDSITLEILSFTGGIRHVNFVASETPPSSPQTPRTNGGIEVTKARVVSMATPTLRNSSQLSTNSFPNSFVDPFVEEDGYTEGRGRKRTKFARHSGAWRLDDAFEEAEHDMPSQPAVTEDEVTTAESFVSQQPVSSPNLAPFIQGDVSDKPSEDEQDVHMVQSTKKDETVIKANDDFITTSLQPTIATDHVEQDITSEQILIEDGENMPIPRLEAVASCDLPLISPLAARPQQFSQLSNFWLGRDASAQSSSPIQASKNFSQVRELDATRPRLTDVSELNIEAESTHVSSTEGPYHVDLDLLQQHIEIEHALDDQAGIVLDMIEVEDMYGPHFQLPPDDGITGSRAQTSQVSEIDIKEASEKTAILTEPVHVVSEPDVQYHINSGDELLNFDDIQPRGMEETENTIIQQTTTFDFVSIPDDDLTQQPRQFGLDGIQDIDPGSEFDVPGDSLPANVTDATPVHRATKRLLDKPPASYGMLSEYFTPQKIQPVANAIETLHDTGSTRVVDQALGSPTPTPTVPQDIGAVREDFEAQNTTQQGIITPLSYYAPLASLLDHFGTVVDVIAICTADSTVPERAQAGPRHYYTTFHLADASPPDNENPTVTVQVFRPKRDALPGPKRGDVVLLRNMKVLTQAHKPLLVSYDESSWAVFHLHASEISATITGPPVEFGLVEHDRVRSLVDWWSAIGHSKYAEISETSSAQVPVVSLEPSEEPQLEQPQLRSSSQEPRTDNEPGSVKDNYGGIRESLSPDRSFQEPPSADQLQFAPPMSSKAPLPVSVLSEMILPHYHPQSGSKAADQNSSSDHQTLDPDGSGQKRRLSSRSPGTLGHNTRRGRSVSSPSAKAKDQHKRAQTQARAKKPKTQKAADDSDRSSLQDKIIQQTGLENPDTMPSQLGGDVQNLSLPEDANKIYIQRELTPIPEDDIYLAPVIANDEIDPNPKPSRESADPDLVHTNLAGTPTSSATTTPRRRYKRKSVSLVHELRDGTQYVDIEEMEVVSVSDSESGSDIFEVDEQGNQEQDIRELDHEQQHERDEHVEEEVPGAEVKHDSDAESQHTATTKPTPSISPSKRRGRPPKSQNRIQKKKPTPTSTPTRVTRRNAGNEVLVHELRDGTEYTDAPSLDDNEV